jgi:hypothetical protein
MKQIRIETLEDSHYCEDCGPSYATGGKVFVDEVEVLCKEPFACCYDPVSFSDTDLLVMALAKLGVEVLVDSKKYEICSPDTEYYTGEE